MKWRLVVITGGGLAFVVGGVSAARMSPGKAAPPPEAQTVLTTSTDKVSYGMGATMARNFKREGVEVDVNALTMGFRDGLSEKKLLMTDEEMRQAASTLQGTLREKRAQAALVAASAAEKEGQEFLANNAKQEGVVVLPSGLQYKVLKAGTGAKPAEDDSVKCEYRGTLVNGTEFDSSERRGQPASFKLTQVIPGWKEALKLMPVGSKWQLFVPPQLAYGERGLGGGKKGAPRVIGANATLIFEVELLGIERPSASAETKVATRALKGGENN